jgi:ring-1,2-phenylacetyl-CoA epoxidase subunit PaaE
MTTMLAATARHELHTLTVGAVDRLTDDAVAITLDVPEHLRELFAFAPGQHVALVRRDAGDELRRSYSVCSPMGGSLRVAVKRLPGGAFSTFADQELRPGDELDVLPPAGRFTPKLDPALTRHRAAIVAGSGITPVLSILASILAIEPGSRCTLIYGNRSTSSVMFLEELEDLKDRYGERLHLIHVFSREPQPVEIAEGRIDPAKLERLLDTLVDASGVDDWLLCGPFSMIESAHETLRRRGVADARVRRELFHAQDAPLPAPIRPTRHSPGNMVVRMVLHGRSTELHMADDTASILDAALAVRPDAPYACKGGVCGTCRCRVVQGQVRMDHAYALEVDEIAAGLTLACQSHPLTDVVTLDFDTLYPQEALPDDHATR